MSQRGSKVSSIVQNPFQMANQSQVRANSFIPMTIRPSIYTSPQKNVYTMSVNPAQQNRRLTSADVCRLTGEKIKEGQIVKGQSRIQYIPYEKKVVDYEMRTFKEYLPKTKKVVDYQEKRVIETVPRQVVKQEFYAVQKVLEKKVQIMPVEKKVKRIQFVPIEKQIVHYPQTQDMQRVKSQSRIVFQAQGINLKPEAQYRPLQQDSHFQYGNSNILTIQNSPLSYVDVSAKRVLSGSRSKFMSPNSRLSNSKSRMIESSQRESQVMMRASNYQRNVEKDEEETHEQSRQDLSSRSRQTLNRYSSAGNLSANVYL